MSVILKAYVKAYRMPRRLYKLVWSDGMYLAPTHFHGQAHFFEDSVQFTRDCVWPYGYGFLSLDIDEDELRQGRLAVRQARGVMPDGLAFETSPEQAPLELAVLPIVPASGGRVTFYLSAPKSRGKLDQSNPSPKLALGDHIGSSIEVGTFDEAHAGSHSNSPGPDLRIVLGSEIQEGESAMPVARLLRDGSGTISMDPDFVPPCLQLAVSARLQRLMDEIQELLVARSRSLARARRDTAVSPEANRLNEIWLQQTVNSAIPVLRHWRIGASPHPADAYLGLSQLAGVLCCFADGADPTTIPDYNHRALGECFGALSARLGELMGQPSPWITVPLQRIAPGGAGPQVYWGAEIRDSSWCQGCTWILGLKAEASETVLAAQMIVSSRNYVARVVNERRQGVAITHLSEKPAGSPGKPGWRHFSVDCQDPLFGLLRRERSIGVYLPETCRVSEIDLYILPVESTAR